MRVPQSAWVQLPGGHCVEIEAIVEIDMRH
jgi:hypothetical protein